MELATALHHSAQRVEAPREGVEGEECNAPRRPKPPLPGKRPAPLVEVAEPQASLGQHSGIGYELVLALDVPVLQMAEHPVDVLVRVDELLKKQEEEEEEVRRWRRTPVNQLTPLQRKKAFEHISKRKRKKRRKKRTPRTSSSRSTPGRARRRHRQWHAPGWFSSVLALFPSYIGRPKLPGIIVGMVQYYSLLRARHRH